MLALEGGTRRCGFQARTQTFSRLDSLVADLLVACGQAQLGIGDGGDIEVAREGAQSQQLAAIQSAIEAHEPSKPAPA
ncbi:hypothetical protein D3C87_1883780 [compost metagenome]